MRLALAVLPAAVAALVASCIPFLRERVSEAWASALWGLLLLFAFVGWGRLVNRWHRPRAKHDWGLDGAMGMAGFLCVGGVLANFRLMGPFAIWITLLGGIGAHAYDRARALACWQAPALARAPGWRLYRIAFFAVILLGLCAYADSIMSETFNQYDDNMSYLGLARKLVEGGHMYEPFSPRRLASFGGQTMLLGAMAAVAPLERLHAIDRGICVLLVLGLVIGYATTPARRAGALLAVVLFLCIRHPHHNLASEISGVVFFLAIFRVLDDGSIDGKHPSANAIVIGLLSAAACTLRQNFLIAVGVTVALHYVFRLASAGASWRRDVRREAALTAGVTLAALAPWMLMSYANAHTILYPIMQGDSNPDWGLMGTVPWEEEIRWFAINLKWPEPARTLVCFVLAGFLLRSGRTSVAVRAHLIGMVVGFVLLVHTFQTSTFADSMARYYFSFVTAYILSVTLRALSGGARSWLRRIPAILVVAGVAVQLFLTRDDIHSTIVGWLSAAKNLVHTRSPLREREPAALAASYETLQRAVPAQASMLVMVDFSYLFDFKRNEIIHFDQPGATSPPPHVPFFQGSDAFARYFLGLGIRYVVFIVGESVEYNRQLWRERAGTDVPQGKRGAMYKIQSRYFLNTFDNFIALTRSRKVLAHEGDYWVVDLEASPSRE
jgi:hypothetical protein